MQRVNHVAILVAVILQMLVGFAWYSESAFGVPWMHAVGLEPEEMANPDPRILAFAIASAIAIAYLMAHLLRRVGAKGTTAGLRWGVAIGALFVALPVVTHHAFALKAVGLMLIDGGKEILTFAVTGAVLGAWSARRHRAPTSP